MAAKDITHYFKCDRPSALLSIVPHQMSVTRVSAKVITHRVRVKTLKLATAKNRAFIVEHSAKSGNVAAILCRMEVEVLV